MNLQVSVGFLLELQLPFQDLSDLQCSALVSILFVNILFRKKVL